MHRSLLLIVTLLALLRPPSRRRGIPGATPQASALTTVASGLISPRGFLWTADGTLYVAQAGSGGESLGTPTAPPPVGPFQGGSTASVVRIDTGCPVLVADGLPSTLDQIGGVLGVEDLAILGDQLYASVDGGGEAHGNASQPSGVYAFWRTARRNWWPTCRRGCARTRWPKCRPISPRCRRVQPGRRRSDAVVLGGRPQQRADPARWPRWIGSADRGPVGGTRCRRSSRPPRRVASTSGI